MFHLSVRCGDRNLYVTTRREHPDDIWEECKKQIPPGNVGYVKRHQHWGWVCYHFSPVPGDIYLEVSGLASGTLARLFGTDNYEEIEHRKAEWLAWIGDRKFDTWQDCWVAFRDRNVPTEVTVPIEAPPAVVRLLLIAAKSGTIQTEEDARTAWRDLVKVASSIQKENPK